MADARRRVLVLYWSPEPRALRDAIARHLRMLDLSDGFDPIYVNTHEAVPRWVKHLRPDAVLLHTTFLCMRWSHRFPTWKWQFRWLADLSCEKIAMPQDEYDHSEILDEWLYELGATLVLSNFGARERGILYPVTKRRARFEHALTGYVDQAVAERALDVFLPPEKRPYDIVYRATHLPFWFGSHGQLKHRIGDISRQRAAALGLTVDISTRAADTIVGDAWIDFLASGRCVVGCESGSSVLDRRGEIRARIQHLLRAEPDLDLDGIDARMWPGWDSYAFFALSPRHLEAVATRTGQILVEGHYDGILEAGRHYIPVRSDLANIDEALGMSRDVATISEITENAYKDVLVQRGLSYDALARRLEDFVSAPGERSRARRTVWRIAARAVLAEQAASARRPRLLGPALSIPRSKLARLVVAARIVRDEPRLRALVRAYRRIDGDVGEVSMSVVLGDILRLWLIGLARSDAGVGVRFDVHVAASSNGSALTFESTPRGRGEARRLPELTPDQASRLMSVWWDHSAIAVYVPYALTRRRWLSIALGDNGRHEFRSLPLLARSDAEVVATALNSVLVPRARRPPALPLRVLRYPRLYSRLVVAVARLAGRISPRLLVTYMLDWRLLRAAPPGALVRDLLRFGILDRMVVTHNGVAGVSMSFDFDSSTLVAESGPAEAADPGISSNGHLVRHLVWNHSAVGPTVRCLLIAGPAPPVALGTDGIYDFPALDVLAARYPRDMSRFFESLLRQAG